MDTFEAIDLETAGTEPGFALQPWRAFDNEAWIRCWSVARMEDGKMASHCFWMESQPHLERVRLLQYLEHHAKAGTTLVGWNVAFDVAWLLTQNLHDFVHKIKWLDASLLYRRVVATTSKQQRYGLKETVAQFFPQYAGYDDDVDFDADTPDGKERLKNYNRLDAIFTLTLAYQFWDKLSTEERRNARIEAASLSTIAESNLTGLRVDALALDALDRTLHDKAEQTLVELVALAPEVSCIELTNTNQIGSLLFETWGLPIRKRTGTGKPSVDRDTLSDLADLDPRVNLIKEWRQLTNTRTKFCRKVADSIAYNGENTTHPQARVYGTYTGRITYTSKQKVGKVRKHREVVEDMEEGSDG